MKLSNKTVLITGGSGGIGQALSQSLIQKGAKVIAFDLKLPEKPIEQVIYYQVDITNSSQIKRALKKLNTNIDILVNNAGIMRRGTLLESSEEDFDLLFKVNFKGQWLMLKLCQQYLDPEAVIVQISSRHGLSLPINPSLYGLSKNAVLSLTKLLVKTHPLYKVKIICPGPINTPLSHYGVDPEALKKKLKIMISPEEFAQKFIILLEKDMKRLIFDEKNWSYKYQ